MLDILIAASCGTAGLLCGWLLRGNLGVADAPAGADSDIGNGTADDLHDRQQVTEVADRLRLLTARMAADVDAHQSRVQEVNDCLHDGQRAPSPSSIADAVSGLIEANEEMQLQLQQAQKRIEEQAERIETAEQRALTDALTRLNNRRALDDRLAKAHAAGPERAGTLVLMDVDNFKQFNDIYGHRAGDEVLRVVAALLKARLQDVAFVARFGGEEFAFIFEGQSLAASIGQAEQARRAICAREILFENQRLRVTACVGVAQSVAGETAAQWIQRADDALYEAKANGRNRGFWMDGAVARPIAEPSEAAPAATAEPAIGGQAEPPSSTADAETESEAEVGDPLQRLPSEQAIEAGFQQMTGRLRQADVELFVMVVRADGVDASSPAYHDVLTVVRASTRSVDRIGRLKCGSLIICMPSIDEAAAVERGHRIRSAVARFPVGTSGDATTVSIGLTRVGASERYESIVARAGAAAAAAAEAGGNRLSLVPPAAVPV